MRPRTLVGIGALAVLGMALLLVFPAGVPGLLDLTAERLDPPPELRLASPSHGDGVGATLTIAGQALGSARPILDVQYRLDGGRWESAPLSARGQRSTPFEATIPVPEGDHLVEARAYDGEALSLLARAQVRRGAPTVTIATPTDGAGLLAGPVVVSGAVRGDAREVLLQLDEGEPIAIDVTAGSWRASLALAPGEHVLRATAVGTLRSLPATARVAAGTPPPPTVALLTPRDASAYGASGDAACGGGCILVTGTAERAARVRVDLDGLLAGEAAVAGGLWSYRVPMVHLANGTHEVSARAIGEDGAESVARSVVILARTGLALRLEGTQAPHPTGTELAFQAIGEGAEDATWTLDGLPLATGTGNVVLALAQPGDHVLSVQTSGARGRASSASVALHALNRAPSLALAKEPMLVEGEMAFELVGEDPDGRVVAYVWDFGEGNRTTTRHPFARHRYAERGEHLATVTAFDDLGAATSFTTPVLVANGAPLADFTWTPAAPTILDVITLRDASIDHDGRIAGRIWELPDGTRPEGAEPQVRLQRRGPHDITLRVVDAEGLPALATRTIVVANLPPSPAILHDPVLPIAREDILFADATRELDGRIVSRRWSMGDGTTSEDETLVHQYDTPGTYLVELTVTDDAGASATLARNLTVLDSAPAVSGVTLEPPEPTAQQAARLAVAADDRDGSILAAHWDFGDGTTSDELAPSHRWPRSGAYQGAVTVFDEAGLHVTFPFSVLVHNALPEVELATLPGARVAAFPTSFFANATDVDGRITYYRFDADGDDVEDCEGVEPVCAHVYEQAGHYVARVTVEDDEGGSAATEILVDVALPPADHPAPRVVVESPAPGATLRGENLLRGEASGPRAIAKVELQLRNGTWAYSGARTAWRLATGAGQWASLLDTRQLPDGAYDLVVRATDEAGGAGFARVPVTIANGPRPSDVSLILGDAPALVEEDLTLRASAFHPEGVTGVRHRIDDAPWTSETEDPLAFTIGIDRDALAPGEHVLRIEAYHGVREMTSIEHVFLVAGTPPTLVIDEHPNTVAHGLLRAEGRIVGEGRAQWRIDQGLWRDLPAGEAWTLHEETLAHASGRHVLSLRAVSPDGRLASEVRAYKIDIVNPPFSLEEQRDAAPAPERAEVPAAPLGALLAALLAAAWTRRRP